MSSKCGNCDCADQTQCVKKGNQYGIDVVENDMSYDGMTMNEGPSCGSCKCGPSCACTSCTCCSH
ncbi:Metallothionein-like protein type 3 [Bienertia sinuspersici]